ncbi:hypothetical protein GCM10025859_44320 [Alicyclobacillus fastidiosus]|nr:hypothetical protein GCM10025859_44320 [Alicyclobacillus fastidiosus]
MNRLFGTGLSLDELAEMGAEIGSDVPFCVYGGTAIARGRGEQLTRVEHRCHMYVLLIHPRVFVSTADIYKGLRPGDFTVRPTSERMVAALVDDDVDVIPALVSNRLQPVTFGIYPEVLQLSEKVEAVTRHPVHMSGSGPTLFLLAPTIQQANRMYNALRGIMRDVYFSQFVGNVSSLTSLQPKSE